MTRDKNAKSAYDKLRYSVKREEYLTRAKERYWLDPDAKKKYDVAYRPRKNARRRERYELDVDYRVNILSADPLPAKRRRQYKEYGLTGPQVEEIFRTQDLRCGCCLRSEPRGKNWNIDHDHVTNKVRGILCTVCNTSIGGLGDDIAGLMQGLAYLKRHYTNEMGDCVDEHW